MITLSKRLVHQDHAVLALKKQRDQLKQYQKRINASLEKDRDLAKRLIKEGKKDRAKLLLRKKKYQEGLLDQTDKQLDQLERLVQDLEFSQIQHQVLDGLKKGNEALERANSIFSIEDVEELMEETQEAVDRQREINELLAGKLTEEDESAVLSELDELLLEGGELEPQLPAVPSSEPEPNLELPSVPSGEPGEKQKVAKQKIAVAES